MEKELQVAIKASPILTMAKKAAELRAGGRDIIDLTLGEPDFSAPSHVIDEAISHISNKMGYSPSNGLASLRTAARAAKQRDRGLHYRDDEITVGCGAKQVIFNAFLTTLQEGDEVIIPTPYWASYPEMVKVCSGKPVIVPCGMERAFKLTAQALEAAITNRTKWVVLNAPGNPSGVLYSEGELASISAVLRQHPAIYILSDEIYAHIKFCNADYISIANVAPDLVPRMLLVDGVSKAYAMTGWRVGWGFGSSSLIARINAVQGQNCTQTSTLSQLAAVAALNGPQDFLAERAMVYKKRRDVAIDVLRSSSLMTTLVPDGAFYLLPKVQTNMDDVELADRLLDAGVATVPGSAFGCSGHLRLSFATDEDLLRRGCERIVSFIGAMS